MKRDYLKPVVKLLFIQSAALLDGTVTNTDSNTKIEYDGGSTEPAQAPQSNVWDEE